MASGRNLTGFWQNARGSLFPIVTFSLCLNVIQLAAPLYVLQIFDRVLVSASLPTLMALTGIVLGLVGLMAALDAVRANLLLRVVYGFGSAASGAAFHGALTQETAARADRRGQIDDPLGALKTLHRFAATPAASALCDAPFVPLALWVIWVIHPQLALIAGGAALGLALAALLAAHLAARAPAHLATRAHAQGAAAHRTVTGIVTSAQRHDFLVRTMGLTSGLAEAFRANHFAALRADARAAEVTTTLAALARAIKLGAVLGTLGLGAALVVGESLSAGAMVAASFLAMRALAPLVTLAASLSPLSRARRAIGVLDAALASAEPLQRLAPPRPKRALVVDRVTITPPGARRPAVVDASLYLRAGEAVGIVGPSGAGKSIFAQALAGILPPNQGLLLLDNAPVGDFPIAALARHIGYAGQDPALFCGTIADNIARFDPDFAPSAVVHAATVAGVHDRILALPAGYNTPVGADGSILPRGLCQHIALARALYGDPFLVVLDAPKTHLDLAGALERAIASVRARGGIVALFAAQPAGLLAVDIVLLMEEGRLRVVAPRGATLYQPARDASPLPPRHAPPAVAAAE